MPKGRAVTLVFPAGGLDKRAGYQSQRPFTTVQALNVRPDDALERRERGGSRPGLIKYDRLAHGTAPGDPIRMLSSVNIVPNDGATFWKDRFDKDTLDVTWSSPAWMSPPGVSVDARTLPELVPQGDPEFLSVQYETVQRFHGLMRSALAVPLLDSTQLYWVDLDLRPQGLLWKGSYEIWLRMSDFAADDALRTTDGDFFAVRIGIEFVTRDLITNLAEPNSDGQYHITLDVYDTGSVSPFASVRGTASGVEPDTLSVRFIPGNGSDDNVTCFWDGTEIFNQNIPEITGNTRVGFGMVCDSIGFILNTTNKAFDRVLLDEFRIQYFADTIEFEDNRSVLVAGSGQRIYVEDANGNMEVRSSALPNNVNISDQHHLMAVEFIQKLYIADYGDIKTTSNSGVIINVGSSDYRLGDLSANFIALGISTDNDTIHVYDASDDALLGSYRIISVQATTLEVALFPSGVVVGPTFSYRIERGPKVYDPKIAGLDGLQRWHQLQTTGKGHVPGGCKLIALFQGRIVMAGNNGTPQEWFMSRVNDPFDWDYFPEDKDSPERAFHSDLDENSKIGVPITALIPGGNDYLMFGTAESLYIMRGNPAAGAFPEILSSTIGVLSGRAWAAGPSGEVLFLSRDGLYAMLPGGGQFPQSISKERLPRAMRDIDIATTEVLMAYDLDAQGYHIHIIPKEDTGRGDHWWFDWETKSFWPVDYFLDHEPRSIYRYESVGPGRGGLVIGSQDGFLRRYSRGNGTDSNVEFPSSVVIGPLKMSATDADGMMTEINAIMAEDSGPVTWTVLVGDTAESALRANTFDSGTFNSGRNPTVRPRARGHAVFLKIEGIAGQAWAMEEIGVRIRQLGKARVS